MLPDLSLDFRGLLRGGAGKRQGENEREERRMQRRERNILPKNVCVCVYLLFLLCVTD